ncbi:MAG TPA: glycosyltransferase [Chitinophagaceae bacterium]|nr:glycosyltransferase [Chitinophagaceae bacterium]
MTLPEVSVIICSYNRAAYIGGALDSLYRQTAAHSSYEVLVVDNNSTDTTPEVCRQFIAVHSDLCMIYLTEARQGASFARNAGAARARGNILVFMDDDATAEPDFIERILSFFQNHPGAGALGGRIQPRYIPQEPKWMSYYVSALVGNFDYSPVTVEFKPGKYPLESNMAVRKADFDQLGGFNTALPGVAGTIRIGGEGKDFFLRFTALGKQVFYDPSVRVQHVVEVKKLTREYLYRVASGIGRGERVRTLQISRAAYWKKHAEYLYKLGGSLVLGLFYTLQGHPAKAAPVIRFRIDAIRGLLNR